MVEVEISERGRHLESSFAVFDQRPLSVALAVLILLSTATIMGQEDRAWSHVQTVARNSGAATNSIEFASTTQPGDLIIAEVDWSEGSDFLSIADSQNNVYTQIGAEQHSDLIGVKSRLYYAANIRGGLGTVTTVVSGKPVWHEVYLHEYSGLDLVSPLDAFSVNVGAGSTFTSGTITTATAHELLYGIEIDSSTGSAISGWTLRSALDGNAAVDGDGPSAGNYTFTGSTAGAFVAWTVAFKQSGAPAPLSDSSAPSVPTGISASAVSPSEVIVSWAPSTDPDNAGTEISYTVLRDGLRVGTTSAGTTTYLDAGLAPATSYSYSVSATDPAGNTSAQSLNSQATTQALLIPIISVFTASSDTLTAGLSATLSWEVSNATSVSIDNGVGSVTGLTAITVSPLSSVTYQLTASNGNGSATAQLTIAVSPDTGEPTVPTNLSGTSDSPSAILLAWTASTDNVAVTGYKVLRNGIQVGVTTATVYSDSNLAADTTYTYAVAADDAAGNESAWSQNVSVTTQPQSASRTYQTTFAASENPISEGGRWINGKAVGVDWSDVATVPGLAIGTQTGSDGFDDSIAILWGNWGPDQSAMATVHVTRPQDSSTIQEVELLLRWAISPHSARGYEINFGTTGQYTQIVRWNGPVSDITYLDSEPLPNPLNEGDVVKATVVGQVITAFVNDVQVAQVIDDTYSDGSPGIGFYIQGNDTNHDFGFTTYQATAHTKSSWTYVQSTARNSGARSNALDLPAATREGDLIVVEVDWSNRSDFVSISDSQGNVFTQIGPEQESSDLGIKSRLYYAANINGGPDSITTVVSGSPGYHELYLHEYAGLDPRSPLEAFSSQVARGTTFSSGSITTTLSHDLLFGLEIDSASGSAAAEWTTRSTLDSNIAADRDASSPGDYAFTGRSTGASITWIVAFKQADDSSLPISAAPSPSAFSLSGRRMTQTWTAVRNAPRGPSQRRAAISTLIDTSSRQDMAGRQVRPVKAMDPPRRIQTRCACSSTTRNTNVQSGARSTNPSSPSVHR